MNIIYDVDALKTMLYDIAELTGITLSAYNYDGNHLADCMHGSLFCIEVHHIFGKKRCQQCGANLAKKCKNSLYNLFQKITHQQLMNT